MKKLSKFGLVGMVVMGAMLFVMTCIFDPIFQAIIHLKMKQMLAVKPGGYSFGYWQKPPVPVFFRIFVFDVVNPEEVLQGGRPSVVEKGPYTYRVSLEKLNITFHDNHTVSYRQRQVFLFDRERSVGWDNETFTTPNAPLFTVGTLLQYQFPLAKEAVNLLMEGLEEKPLITVSVSDIFWGYEDRFLMLAKDVLDKLHVKSDLITGIFGYYMGKNNTDDGLYTVYTGTDDLSKFLIIDKWNHLSHLDYWSTPLANMINGTDGSLYPPFVTTDRVLQMYDSNLFRSMSMVYQENSEVLGVPTMKFIVKDDEFANATVNPWNAGFCTPRNQCIPSGVLNCSAMGHGAPLYVSLPHFLGADPYYFRLVEGVLPDRERHQPYFHLHQLTGVCLSAGRRYQLNIQMKEYPFLSKTHGLPLAYIPVLWLDGVAKVDDSIGGMFKNQIEIPLTVIKYFRYSLFGIGPVMMLIPAIVFHLHRQKNKKKLFQNGHAQNGYGHNGSVQNGLAQDGHAPVDETVPNERTHLIPPGHN
ncbi:scavenger receptor class B member 1-like [Babylonia areolata]|uniref:scavenger receptor class B member 1-like n=1 Tax=Babylonia areolata TaxID=304850 RepID=UPI003FD5B943